MDVVGVVIVGYHVTSKQGKPVDLCESCYEVNMAVKLENCTKEKQ